MDGVEAHLVCRQRYRHKPFIKNLLIGVEGAQTPAGAAAKVRPRRIKATRRLI
ncbi:hypothetical protein V7201_17505 [Bacillus sp. JJ1122]